nr:serine/threonine protein kinase [Pirellula sp.]
MGNSSDRNLLFGVIAFQNQLITRDQLLAAIQAWSFEKSTPLGEHLVRLGALQAEQRERLEVLVSANLQRHDNDPQKCMAELSSLASSFAEQLKAFNDQEINATVAGWHHANESMSWDGAKPSSGTVRMGKPADDGRVVGRFKILKHHARGGLGEVWVAQDLELGREVAFKEIQDDKADYQPYRSRFVREAEVTSALEHPGIVPIYGMGQFPNGRPFYAMRFLDKKTLFHEIEQFHLDRVDPVLKLSPTELNLRLRRLLQRFIDICEAMDYAHSRGVLHRDLKPQNIMIGRYGETLVVDWGLAKVLGKTPEVHEISTADPLQSALPTVVEPVQSGEKDSSDATQLGTTIGTVLYMSPEQAHGRHNELTPASDVFSLGAILYEILTGKTLYGGTYDQALAGAKEAKYKSPREINGQIPKPLEAVCLKALAKDSAERYPTAKLLAKDIEAYVADEPVTAKRDTLWERAGRIVRRHRGAFLSSTAALVLVTIVSVISALVIDEAKQKESAALSKERDAKAEAINASKATDSALLRERQANY